MGSYDIDFDSNGMPVLPKFVEAMHARAALATTSRDAEKVHHIFVEHETNLIHDFYKRLRAVADYAIRELHDYHLGKPLHTQEVMGLIMQYQAETSRLRLKLLQIEQFQEGEQKLFEQWRHEDDRVRHVRLSKHLRNQEEAIYKIDKSQLKIGEKAKSVCAAAAATLQRTNTLLDMIKRAFSQEHYGQEDTNMLAGAFNDLLRQMNDQIHWLKLLDRFELKNIALFDKQIKLDFMAERAAEEDRHIVM